MAPQAQVTNLMHKAQPSRYKAKATAQSTGKLKTAKGREAAKQSCEAGRGRCNGVFDGAGR